MRVARRAGLMLSVMAVFLVASCSTEITIQAELDVTDVEVDGEYVGTLNADQEVLVEVTGRRPLVTWRVDGSSQSDDIENPRDGEVYHIRYDYITDW